MKSNLPILLGVSALGVAAIWYDARNEAAASARDVVVAARAGTDADARAEAMAEASANGKRRAADHEAAAKAGLARSAPNLEAHVEAHVPMLANPAAAAAAPERNDREPERR